MFTNVLMWSLQITSREGDTCEVLPTEFYQFVYSCIWKSVGNTPAPTQTHCILTYLLMKLFVVFNKLILGLL